MQAARAGRTSLLLLLLALSACEVGGVLAPHGVVAREERTILLNSLFIMLAIVIPTIVATVAFAWWYRASNTRARYLPQWAYSGRIELVVWSIPTLVILFLSGVIWTGSHELDPARRLAGEADPLEVQVVALDWKWLFIYPSQNVASVNRLVIPAGQPIHFSITSASVMNQFHVPQLGGMIAAMNRMVTHLNLQADKPGEYYGRSAQFSGHGFSDMQFVVQAVTQPEFTQWAGVARSTGRPLNREEYTALARQSVVRTPFTFRQVDGELFQEIVTHAIPPAPGPDSTHGAQTAHSQGAH